MIENRTNKIYGILEFWVSDIEEHAKQKKKCENWRFIYAYLFTVKKHPYCKATNFSKTYVIMQKVANNTASVRCCRNKKTLSNIG